MVHVEEQEVELCEVKADKITRTKDLVRPNFHLVFRHISIERLALKEQIWFIVCLRLNLLLALNIENLVCLFLFVPDK